MNLSECLRMRDPLFSTPADELPDLRRDALRLVPEQQMAGTFYDLELRARDTRREHARIRDRHERIVVAADDERLMRDLGQEAPARPADAAEQLHGITVRARRQPPARAARVRALRGVAPRDAAVHFGGDGLEVSR